MANQQLTRPRVLIFAGHDPSGGAGLQADIETLAANRCHGLPILTAWTVQNTHRFVSMEPLSGHQISAQASCVLEEFHVAACKIGLIGSVEALEAIGTILADLAPIPVVLDPVLRSTTGGELADAELQRRLVRDLLPLTTVLTPNALEARCLSGMNNDVDAAAALLASGCRSVFITGADQATPEVTNRLFENGAEPQDFICTRLPGSYHGSGCTLATAIAAGLAQGHSIAQAISAGQKFTWEALAHAEQTANGQALPNRLC